MPQRLGLQRTAVAVQRCRGIRKKNMINNDALPRIEVVDFFWYSCPHCNAFEPLLQAWSRKLPEDVVLRRVPAAFRDDMVPQ